jgi:hypothetical protein
MSRTEPKQVSKRKERTTTAHSTATSRFTFLCNVRAYRFAPFNNVSLAVPDAMHLLRLIPHDQNGLWCVCAHRHACVREPTNMLVSVNTRFPDKSCSSAYTHKCFYAQVHSITSPSTMRASRSSTSSRSKIVGSKRKPFFRRSLMTAPNIAVERSVGCVCGYASIIQAAWRILDRGRPRMDRRRPTMNRISAKCG